MAATLAPLNLARALFLDSLANQLIVVYLQPSFLICVLQCVLEVACNALLAKFFLNSVDDRHDTLNVPVKDVTNLQALERDLAIFLVIV